MKTYLIVVLALCLTEQFFPFVKKFFRDIFSEIPVENRKDQWFVGFLVSVSTFYTYLVSPFLIVVFVFWQIGWTFFPEPKLNVDEEEV